MTLETIRLRIRGLHESDWQEMQKIAVDFRNSPYAVYDMPLPTEDDHIKALTKSFAESGLFFAVFPKEADNMLGYVCFHKDGGCYDLGYCFHSAYQAKGYAYESTKALVEHFAKEHGAAKFTAGTAMDNTPSRKLLDKLGFTCVSTETVSFDPAFSFTGGNFELQINR